MNFHKDLKIEKKFLVVPILVSILTALFLGVYLYILNVNKTMLASVVQNELKEIQEISDLFSKISQNHVQMFDLLAQANQDMDQENLYVLGKEKLNQIHQFKSDYEVILTQFHSDESEEERYANTRGVLSNYLEVSIRAIGMVTVDLQLAERAMVQANKSYMGVNTHFLSLIEEERQEAFTHIAHVLEGIGKRSTQLGIFLAFSMFSIVLTTWAVSRSFSKEIMLMIELLKRLAAGERKLIVPNEARKDEIGTLARATRVFKNTLIRLEESEQEAKALNTSLLEEIQERKGVQQSLSSLAIRDSLTGLYNRRYFDSRIVEEFARARRKNYPLAILLCDLDGFKHINDEQGHQAGDAVLIAVAKCMLESTRGTDTVFRWGGDEIAVILPEGQREGVQIVADRIRQGIKKITAQGFAGLDISIGVAFYPEHGSQPDELLRLADKALYIAKRGGDKIHVGEEEYSLDDQTISVVFQAVMDIGLNQPVGYEALSRDPLGRTSILQLFKRYQAIGQLQALKTLCFHQQIKAARAAQLKVLFINVDFKLLDKISPLPLPPGMEIVLEISEGEALEDVDYCLEVAGKWKKAKYKFAMDDFGAGFISLPFIARLVPEYIKLDRSTVLQAVASSKFCAVLKDLIYALRKTATDGIIAEGIETEKELSVMKGMGIYLIQGYLFGKPKEISKGL